ncbi:MAG: prephenate dehydrogenase [Victivallales bacterium]|nr:prephenate dehydrogenase [Victivallales bacterium]
MTDTARRTNGSDEAGRTMTVVGLGLIGGSMATDLRRRGFANRIIGVDSAPMHCEAAVRLGLVDETTDLATAVAQSDYILVAIPVSASLQVLPQVLDLVTTQTVTDVGSTKRAVVDALRGHPKRSRFVPSHPMAGTENSGPWAALPNLFEGKAGIVCDVADSDEDALREVEAMYRALNMRLVRLRADQHDEHVAYVSHISHVTSFALALTVLEKEEDEHTLFDLASGGFSSTARLAKSSPEMWTPIFRQNADNVLNVLDEYLKQVQRFRDCLVEGDAEGLTRMIRNANDIRRVLNG